MPQKFLSIKNYEKYQKTKTKEGTRPWIKLWKTLLSDHEFMKLTPEYRFLYIGLILLADDCGNKIYADSTYLRQRLYITHTEGIHGAYIGDTKLDLRPLYRAGFLNTSNLSRVLSEAEADNSEAEADIPQAPLPGGTRTARGKTIFPDEWKLTDEDKAGWLRFGLNASVEFASFRDHALANDRRCANWQAAFRNWCRKSIERKDRHVSKVQ